MEFYLSDNEFEEQIRIFKYIEEKNIIKKTKEKEEQMKKENEEQMKKEREKCILMRKINTYPIIPKTFHIQKKILNINNRTDEIAFIDELIMEDKYFLKYLFIELLNSFSGIENENFIKLIHVTKYQTEYHVYNGLKTKLKDGYNSNVFKWFLINYFKYKNNTENKIYSKKNEINIQIIYSKKNEINMQKILIFSPTLFYSAKFLCELTKNIIGIKDVWDNIYSFL